MYNFLRTIRTCMTSKTAVLTATGVVLALTMLPVGCARVFPVDDVDLAPPSARPANLAAEIGNNQVVLTWGNVSDAEEYRVYRADSPTGDMAPVTAVTRRTFIDSGVTNDTTYRYIVRAANSAGEGPDSAEISVTPMAIAPPAPANFIATAGDSQVTLSWNRAVGATEYRVYRADPVNPDLTTIATIIGDTTTPPETTYIDTDVTNDTEYSYTVRGYNELGEGPVSVEISATPTAAPTAPLAPANLIATPGDTEVSLAWDEVTGADGYRVYRADTANAPLTLLPIGDINDTNYTDTGLTNGTAYRYTVRAFNSVGESPDSTEVSATPVLTQTAPPAPENLTATAADAQITLSWGEVADADEYRIFRAEGTSGTLARIDESTTINTTTYTDTGLTNDTEYRYTVRAVNSIGESPDSSEASATPIAPTAVPAAPANLTITIGDQSLTLRWDAVPGATQYYVYRGESAGTRILIPETTITNPTYTDTGLTNGTEYYYTVRAANSFGGSPHSAEVSATPAAAPLAPANLTANPGSEQVTLSWDIVADVDGYRVYRADTANGNLTSIGQINDNNTIMYTDADLTNGTPYRYTVRTFNSVGESPDSNEISVIPTASTGRPATPTNLRATASGAANVFQVELIWNEVPGATEYRIYRTDILDAPHIRVRTDSDITVSRYTDTGLTADTTYSYIVVAVNNVGQSQESLPATATTPALPAAPENLTAAVSILSLNVFQIRLSWDAVMGTGDVSYEIYRTTAGEPLTRLAVGSTVDGTAHVDLDPNLRAGTTYRYIIRAVDRVGTSADSAAATETIPALPAAPANLSATVSGDANVFQVELTWNAVPGATGYRIYRAEGISGGTPTRIANNITARTYTDSGLTNGTTYRYTVRAVNNVGEGTASDEVSVTTPPTAPANLTATGGNARVSLSWDEAAGAAEYRVYRATTADGTFTRIASGVTIMDPNHTDTGLTGGTTYWYLVRAVNSNGESTDSNIVNITVPTVPTAPMNLSAIPADTQVTLSWNAVGNAAEYRIYSVDTNNVRTRIANTTMITGTGYIDTGLTNGTPYRYTVRAFNNAGESPDGAVVTATPVEATTVPAAPSLSADAGLREVRLSWNPVPGATEYRIYRAATSTGALERIASGVTIEGISYTDTTDTGLIGGTTYRYTVSALNGAGESLHSTEVSAVPDDHGNTIAAATLVPVDPMTGNREPVNSNIEVSGDVDYFRIEVTGASASTPVTINATAIGNMDSDGTLFNGDGIQIGSDAYNGRDAHFQIIRSFTENGTYYIRVHGGNDTTRFSPTGRYTLTVTTDRTMIDTITPGATPDMNTDTHSNIRSLSTPIRPEDGAVPGWLNARRDFDYFSIAVTGASSSSPMTLTAETTGATDTFGILFDSNGIELTLNDDIDDGSGNRRFSFVHSITADGTYYIRVGGLNHTSLGPYSLTVTITP